MQGVGLFSLQILQIYIYIYYKTRALSCKKNYVSSSTLYFLPGIKFRKINNHSVNFPNHGPPVFDTPMSDAKSFSRQPKTGQKVSTASPLFRVHSFCDKEAHVALARRLRPSLFASMRTNLIVTNQANRIHVVYS